MTAERFIVRLMDAAGQLLAWAEILATPQPQGRPRSTPLFTTGRTLFPIEQDGLATHVVIHWVDLDLVRVGPEMPAAEVRAGQVFEFTWLGPVWMLTGTPEQDIPLPAVTVRTPVTIAVRSAAMGARGTIGG